MEWIQENVSIDTPARRDDAGGGWWGRRGLGGGMWWRARRCAGHGRRLSGRSFGRRRSVPGSPSPFLSSSLDLEICRSNAMLEGSRRWVSFACIRSNFLGTKFTIYDGQPHHDAIALSRNYLSRRINSRKVSPRVPSGNHNIGTISYELNLLRTRGPRRMECIINSISASVIQDGGAVPIPTPFCHSLDEQLPVLSVAKPKDPAAGFSSNSFSEVPVPVSTTNGPLILKNIAPRCHELASVLVPKFQRPSYGGFCQELPACGSCYSFNRSRPSDTSIWENWKGYLYHGLSISTLSISGICHLLEQL